MADAVNIKTVFNGGRRLVVRLTNVSDGTGEAAVIKVDKSTFTGPDGTEPTSFVVEKIEYDILGMQVQLHWDHTTPDIIAVISGAGYLDWVAAGGLVDPLSAGGTGDIELTTVGHTAGDSYTITLWLRKKD